MNITLLANRDLASQFAISQLVNQLADHRLSIFLSEKVGGDRPLPQPIIELGEFEQNLLGDGRPTFDELAATAGCSVAGFSDLDNRVNSPEGVARIQATEPELIISLRFGLIIREKVIAIPRYGVINLHSGLLPDYRGVMATFRAMLNNDREIASTLHFIQDSGVDTGDIISTLPIPLMAEKSYLFNVLNLYSGGCEQILQAVATIAAGQPLTAQPQQGSGEYFSFPTEAELTAFFASGQLLFASADAEHRNTLDNTPHNQY